MISASRPAPLDEIEQFPGPRLAAPVGFGMTGFDYFDFSRFFRVAFLDYHHPRSDPIAEDLFDGDGHRRAGLSGADHDHALECVKVVLAPAGEQPGPVERNAPRYGLVRLHCRNGRSLATSRIVFRKGSFIGGVSSPAVTSISRVTAERCALADPCRWLLTGASHAGTGCVDPVERLVDFGCAVGRAEPVVAERHVVRVEIDSLLVARGDELS